jgi:hypothetical protein
MNKRKWWLGAIVLLVVALLIFLLITTPQQQRLNDGSTYSRQPSGYGAWYASMASQGVIIKRWQKPAMAIITKANAANVQGKPSKLITLLQVNPQLSKPPALTDAERKWLSQGNRLVILGSLEPVTAAEFLTTHASPVGLVKIQSSRRQASQASSPLGNIAGNTSVILGDRFGAIIWEENIGKGKLILATTPHLGANAYQKEPGNFQLLTQLVDNKNEIYVDEYLHGYRDAEEIAQSGKGSWVAYMGQTPVFVMVLQAGVIFLLFLWGYNQRFGRVVPLTIPTTNNSEAYIQAIAAVLERANCSDFLVETIGRAEQIKLQKSLGLGSIPVAPEVLLETWQQSSGKSAGDLAQVLQSQAQISKNQANKKIPKSQAILDLLEKWQRLN